MVMPYQWEERVCPKCKCHIHVGALDPDQLTARTKVHAKCPNGCRGSTAHKRSGKGAPAPVLMTTASKQFRRYKQQPPKSANLNPRQARTPQPLEAGDWGLAEAVG